MIISHRHRFIFFAVPKTGTHAVRQALRPQLGPEDLEQVGLFEKKRFPFPEFAEIPHGHLSVRQIRPVLGEATFAAYRKFAFVRNPFDRFVSYCAFVSRKTDDFRVAPTAFMKYVIKELRPLDHLLYRPQSEFLIDQPGAVAMDFVGRTETMQSSYDAIAAAIGIPSQSLDIVNASTHAPYSTYYDDELIELVGTLYRDDLRLFGYAFDRHASQPTQDDLRSTARAD